MQTLCCHLSSSRLLDFSTSRLSSILAPDHHRGDSEKQSSGCDEGGAEAETRGQNRAGERSDEAAYRGERRGQAEHGSSPLHWGEVGDERVGRGNETARGNTHQPLQQ